MGRVAVRVDLDHHSTQHCYSAHFGDVFCRLYLLLVRSSIKALSSAVGTHYALQRHMHTHHPPPSPPLPFTVAESPESALCPWWCCGELCGLQWLQQETHCLHCQGREWCEVRRSNLSTVHHTRVWCGVWVVWYAAVLVAGE